MTKQVISFRLLPNQRVYLTNFILYMDYDSFFRKVLDECNEMIKTIDDEYERGKLQSYAFKLEPDTYERIRENAKVYGLNASQFVRRLITAKVRKLC